MAGTPRIVIAGCGIGGLTLALCLRRAGIEFVVLEQAEALTAVGAGIQLSPNAVRVLHWLGLGEPLARVAVAPIGLEIRSHHGELILSTPLGAQASNHFGAPYYHAHRADLLDALVGALGLDKVQLGKRVLGFDQDAAGVSVDLADGPSVAGDLLVGADGIHSVVRAELFGVQVARFSGTAWRGVVPAERVAEFQIPEITSVWWGPHRSMVHYYVSGGRAINWIGIAPADGASIESWSATGSVEQALDEFDGWHPQIRTLIRETAQPFKWALHDRNPLPCWVTGRTALLGDAAHSMLPYHAQGAAQSIEDAWVLARCLEEGADDIPAALSRYESLRQPRTSWVQRFSRDAEVLFHMADPAAVERRDRRLKENQAAYPNGFPPGQENLYGYDAEAPFRDGTVTD